MSGEPVKPLYTAADLPTATPTTAIGFPGAYPFTRGVYPSMYRGRLWTMRQFAGFGTAEETNERFHYLLAHGQTGLSTAFDMPSLMGHDSDHAALARRGRPRGRGRRHARRHGDAVRGHRPRRGLGLDDDQRARGDHARLLRRGRRGQGRSAPSGSRGTIQTDILKEYIAQKEWCFPVDPAMRLVGDMIEWCSDRDAALAPGLDLRLPHPRGRLDRRAGAGLHAQGRPDLRRAGRRPRAWTSTTSRPRLSFFFNAHIDFFEEIAKYRAARRIWARELRDTFGAKDPQLVADALPHADGRRLADRPAAAEQHRPHGDRGARRRARRHAVAAHQLLRRGARAAHRGGRAHRAAHPADHRPRDRRDDHDRPARRRLLRRGADRRDGARRPTRTSRKIDELGGMVEAVKQGFPQREIADAAYQLQTELEDGSRIVGRRQRATPRPGTSDAAAAAHRPGARGQADRPRPGRPRPPRRAAGRGRRSRRSARPPRRTGATSCRRCSTAPARTPPRARSSRALQDVFGTYTETPVF